MSVDVTVELFIEDTWVDITAYVRVEPGVEITFGVSRENATADPAEARMYVNNADGRFTPRYTSGAYYPFLTRNTPLRVSVDPGGGNVVRFVGAVSEFPVRWDPSEADWWVPLTAHGPTRRLARANVLTSTLHSAILSLAAGTGEITGYWPVEDSPGSSQIFTPLAGGVPGTYSGSLDFSAVDPGVMSHEIATWGGASGVFTPAAAVTTSFSGGALFTFPPTGSLSGGEELIRFDNAGTAASWRLLYSPSNGGQALLQIMSDAGVELHADTIFPTDLDGTTVFLKIEVDDDGADVDWYAGSPQIGSTGTEAGVQVSAVTTVRVGGGTIAIPADGNVAIGHVVVASTGDTLADTVFDDGLSGYAGESIQARLDRLETQYGQPITRTPADIVYVEQGAQPDGSLLDVLRAAEAADVGGILHDSLNEVNTVHYIPRRARYNDQRTSLTLDYAAGEITALEPTDDDANLRNDVTVNRAFGSTARATLTTGALSSADYPDGVGLYAYETTLNTYQDSALPYVADWLLALGTIDEARWPRITIDLVKNPSLVAEFDALRPGHPVIVENLPAISGVSDVYLHCVGWTETLSSVRRLVTLNCVPGTIWGAAGAVEGGLFELDDAVFGELDVNRLAL